MGLISRVSSRTYRSKKSSSNLKMSVDKIASIKVSNPDNIMAHCFDEAYFNTLDDAKKAQLLKCCNSGIDCPDSDMGCYAMNPSDYDDFKPFFQPVLERYHKVDLSKKGHENNWDLNGMTGLPEDGKLDVSRLGLSALSMRIRTARNLESFPLPGAMNEKDRKDMELAMGPVFDQLIANPDFGGEYV